MFKLQLPSKNSLKNSSTMNIEWDLRLCLVFLPDEWGHEDKKHGSEYVIAKSSF